MKKPEKKNIEDIFALTPLQESILYHFLENPSSATYLEQVILNLSGPIDRETFRQAWQMIINRHAALRTIFLHRGINRPVQVVLKQVEPDIEFIRTTELQDRKNVSTAPFDLTSPPFKLILVQPDEENCQLIINSHHILYDGWSSGIIINQFHQVYNHLMNCNEFPPLAPVHAAFKEYVRKLQQMNEESNAEHSEFWSHYLALPADNGSPVPLSPASQAFRQKRLRHSISNHLAGAINAFLKRHKLTPAALYYSAWGLLLQDYLGEQNILFDTTVSGRDAMDVDLEHTVGLFINTLPLHMTVQPDDTAVECISRTLENLNKRRPYEATSRLTINRIAEAKKCFPAVQSLVVIENYPIKRQATDSEDTEDALTIHSLDYMGQTPYDLTVLILDMDGLFIDIYYCPEQFNEHIVEGFAQHIDGLLNAIIQHPEQPAKSLHRVKDNQRNAFLSSLANRQRQIPSPQAALTAPRSQIEMKLLHIWSEVLARETSDIGIDSHFFHFGGHSLKAGQLQHRIEKEFNVKIPLSRIFETPTIRQLAPYIEGLTPGQHSVIPAVEEKEYYPLSSTQQRIYLQQQLDPGGTAYNGPYCAVLEGDTRIDRLQWALQTLIRHHESLRTSFHLIHSQVVQRIHSRTDVSLKFAALTGSIGPIKELIRPFDLGTAPLFSASYAAIEPGKMLILLDMHHIITDGISTAILFRDLNSIYRGGSLQPPAVRYRDYSEWQNRRLSDGSLETQASWWLKQLAGELIALNLPTDFQRPPVKSFHGGELHVTLDGQLFRESRDFIDTHGGTWYMFWLSIFTLLLSRYCSQEEIIIGTPTAGRDHQGLAHTVGLFMDGLVMRNSVAGNPAFSLFFNRVKTGTLNAFENGGYPLGELLERLDLPHIPGRNPLFDVLLNVQNQDSATLSLPNVTAVPVDTGKAVAKMDLTLDIIQAPDALEITIEYATALFKPETIERMKGHLLHLAGQAIQNPELKLEAFQLLTPREKKQLEKHFNTPLTESISTEPLHVLFQRQAARTPDATAVECSGEAVSYALLNKRANQMARYLLAQPGENRPAALFMDRSIQLFTAIFAILKSGRCYIPLDPVLPLSRMEHIIKDSASTVLIVQEAYLHRAEALVWTCPSLNTLLCPEIEDLNSLKSLDEGESPWTHHRQVWDYIGETAGDDIQAGGWLSSFTGLPLSEREMEEYSSNVYQKLKPFLGKDKRVLEIGCASGLTMYRVAPEVGIYHGSDLSPVIIARNSAKIKAEAIDNIRLHTLPAHRIAEVDEQDFDLIIINSVIQDFGYFNYLRVVLVQALNMLAPGGMIFVGDVMDLEQKPQLLNDLLDFKHRSKDGNFKTKTVWDDELFVPKVFFTDLAAGHPGFITAEFSDKIHTIENELTRYRYDVLLKTTKTSADETAAADTHPIVKPTYGRQKYRHGMKELSTYPESAPQQRVKPEDPVYILYTSGSSGVPKGVVVEHRNVTGYIDSFIRQFPLTGKDVVMQQASPGFDVMVEEAYPVLIRGGRLVISSAGDLADGPAIARFIQHHGVTLISVSPLMLKMLNHLPDKSMLQSVRFFISGGDVLTPGCIDQLAALSSVYNTYGPTESTVCASYYHCLPPLPSVLPIGKPIPGIEIRILSSHGQLQPIGIPGELCVSGRGVTRGYLNNPELTHRQFPLTKPGHITGRFYKTGDRARWLTDGNILFLGRIDRQVKVRGYRIETGEIESHLNRHEEIQDAVVVTRPDPSGSLALHAYLVFHTAHAGTNMQLSQLREYLERSLPAYMIPASFTVLDHFPVNASGKIDLRAMQEMGRGLVSSSTYEAPANTTESRLLDIWSKVLGIPRIGVLDDFFELGGHSLNAVALASFIHKEFNVKLSLPHLFSHSTIRKMAALLESSGPNPFSSIEAAEKREYYPASSQQKRLYAMETSWAMGTAYHISRLFEIRGKLERSTIQKGFQTLVRRHESLRTSFIMVEGDIVQRIEEDPVFSLPCPVDDFNAFIRPFDLSTAPLLRVGLSPRQDGWALIIDIHHIVSDGVSMEILAREFMTLAAGEILEPQWLQYKDYCQWMNSSAVQMSIDAQGEYWKERLSGDLPRLNLPLDFQRPEVPGFSGDRVMMELEPGLSAQLKEFCTTNGYTSYMVFVSIFTLLLSRLSGQEDILVGAPTAGRRHKGLESMTGMFVNTLVISSFPQPDKPLKAFFDDTKKDTLAAFENQEYPYEALVDSIGSSSPLFDVMFVLQDNRMTGEESWNRESGAFSVFPRELANPTAKFDLTLEIINLGDRWRVAFEYNTSLFLQAAVQQLLSYFHHLTRTLCQDFHPQRYLKDIELLPGSEKERLLAEFNDTVAPFPAEKTIHQLFHEQALRTPDRIAIIGEKKAAATQKTYLSYREVNAQVEQVSAALKKQGVLPGAILPVHQERSIDMVIQILAILSAGAVYMPIDPAYPAQRVEYMLTDSGPGLPLGTNSPAYIIYTSGSTGKPKGVIVEHVSAVNLLTALQDIYPLHQDDVYMFKTSFTFDVSVTELFGWFIGGGTLAVPAPGVEKDPRQIIEFIQTHGVTHINFVPSMFHHFVDSLDPWENSRLSTLKYIFLAGEALPAELVNRFNSLAVNARLENIYGPTEATVYAAGYSLDRWHSPMRVPIGRPLPNVQLVITGRNQLILPPLIAGELCISGTGLARGYLNNPELTAERFVPSATRTLFEKRVLDSQKRFIWDSTAYRTGDLARWMVDGNIQYLGRMDSQVKIRGFRIEPGEIENCLLKHSDIKEAVVMVYGDEDDRFLCAYVVSGVEIPLDALHQFLSARLPHYMIPASFQAIEELPLTPGGKIDRSALPVPHIDSSGYSYSAPSTPNQKILARLWQDVLPVNSSMKIGIHDSFFRRGGHSLTAIKLVQKIQKEFNVQFSLPEIFDLTTIQEQAAYITRKQQQQQPSLPFSETREYYPMTPAQMNLYTQWKIAPHSTVYNMPSLLKITGPLDKTRLEDAFCSVIQRHQSLRTSFLMRDEQPVQRVHAVMPFVLEEIESGEITTSINAFDLETLPLIRAAVQQVQDNTWILLLDMHHIISDGSSLDVIYHELATFYRGESPQEPGLQYSDYVMWRQQFPADMTEPSLTPRLRLHLDYPRPAVIDFSGELVAFRTGAEQGSQLNKLVQMTGQTLNTILMGMYSIFLSKISGQDEIPVGSPISGRNHPELQRVTGMFVHTPLLITKPLFDKDINRFLEEVKTIVLEAYESNQHYNGPLDTMFVLQQQGQLTMNIPGLRLEPQHYPHQAARCDLTLIAEQQQDELCFTFQYAKALFKKETIQRFAGFFKRILFQVIRQPNLQIKDIEIISSSGKRLILHEFNRTEASYPAEKTIHQLFEEQAARTPGAIAIIGNHSSASSDWSTLTYNMLNRQSSELAHELNKKGVSPGHIIAITMPPGIDMIVAILAVLKSGAAYLPIDPAYPRQRINHILNDSGAGLLHEDLTISNPGKGVLNHSDSAYIIYTSGTSGRPKGVVVGHRSLVNLCSWHNSHFQIVSHDRATKYAGTGFDASVWEMFPYLAAGASLIIVPEDIKLQPRALNRFFLTHQVTVAFLPTPIAELFMEQDNAALRLLLTGGDRLRRFHSQSYKVYNNYGPTENTVVTTSCQVKETSGDIPIGKPIDNNRIYILDSSYSHLQPIGIPGELCISGHSLAMGYLNQPELTADLFISSAAKTFQEPLIKNTTANSPLERGGPRSGGVCLKRGKPRSGGVCLKREKPQSEQFVYYKTGDLALWLPDGNIQFLGRRDQQVKIRGFRIELQEIEQLLLTHSGIADCAVLLHNDENEEGHLYAYAVPASPASPSSLPEQPQENILIQYLSNHLPDYMVPEAFVFLDSLPLTANGKVNRQALPKPIVQKPAKDSIPEDPSMQKLAAIWSDLLDVPIDSIHLSANFFRMGGHSLKATRLAARIEQEMGICIPLPMIFKRPMFRSMVEYIGSLLPQVYSPIPPVEDKEYYPLSSAQKRMYILNRLKQPGDTSDNTPEVVLLHHHLDRHRFDLAVHAMIARHDVLRTAFITMDGQPVQRILPVENIDFSVVYKDAGHSGQAPFTQWVQGFIRPFKLDQPPLLRMELVKLEEDKHLLMYDMHHIIRDGTSAWIFIREFFALYRGDALPPLDVQYKDFSQWQNRLLQSPAVARQEQYWLDRFADAASIPPLELPLDFPRPAVQSFQGDFIDFHWDRQLSAAVTEVAAQVDATLYMILLAIYNILLSRTGGVEDIVVGMPIAGRRHAATIDMIGMFVNTLPMRNQPRLNQSFGSFLEEVKQNALDGYQNQDYQFEELIRKLDLEKEPSRQLLFDTMFAVQNTELDRGDSIQNGEELIIEPIPFEEKITQFDIILHAYEQNHTIHFRLRYCTRLFTLSTIRELIGYFEHIAREVTQNPAVKIGAIDLMGDINNDLAITQSRKEKLKDLELELEF